MERTDITLYEAFKAKDTRFDGRFFVGISSTKVYCRPVCWAKQAKRENCTFFPSAAAAERAGYRPCLLCRPELISLEGNIEEQFGKLGVISARTTMSEKWKPWRSYATMNLWNTL